MTDSSWPEKIQEIFCHSLRHVALFLTGLSTNERFACYTALQTLQRTHSFSIPFVHAKSDMSEYEYSLIIDSFGTKLFNLHPSWDFPHSHRLSAGIKQKILLENCSSYRPVTVDDLEGFAGLCLDLSHLEDSRITSPKVFDQICRLAETTPVLANHLSAVGRNPSHIVNGLSMFSTHDLNCGNMQYLRNLPSNVISDMCAIEVENTLAAQLTAAVEIESILAEAPLQYAA